MPRPPLPLLTLGALAVLAGVVTGVALNGAEPEPPRPHRVDTAPAPTRETPLDGPPMDYRDVETPTTTAARPGPPPTTTAAETTPPTAARITSTAITAPKRTMPFPELSVSVPVRTSAWQVPATASGT